MEVHHHPQLKHNPKPWKEYILEYIMIFLAVMTGFVAESYREHLDEHSKEHEYVINIKKDLVRDTANLDVWIPSLGDRVEKFDKLISYLEVNGTVMEGANMYFLGRLSTRNAIFEPQDNTVLEMKSSGNLRLIRNRDIINGLMNLERSLAEYRNLVDIEEKEDVMSYPLIGKLFNASLFNQMMSKSKTMMQSEMEYAGQSVNLLEKPQGNPQLISQDREKINELIYYLHQRKSSFVGEIRHLARLLKLETDLLDRLNSAYGLANE